MGQQDRVTTVTATKKKETLVAQQIDERPLARLQTEAPTQTPTETPRDTVTESPTEIWSQRPPGSFGRGTRRRPLRRS